MKLITLAVAAVTLFWIAPASADVFEFRWQSEMWTRTYESPTQPTVSGPFRLSGTGSATFVELATGGAELRFDTAYGGTLVAAGDGTFNGPLTFPTAGSQERRGLGVLTPTADGFTVRVHRAASGPDAGATFFGTGTRRTVAASEPLTAVLVAAALASAGRLAARRPRA